MRLLIWVKTGLTGQRLRHQPCSEFLPNVRISVNTPTVGKIFPQSAGPVRYAHQLSEGSTQ